MFYAGITTALYVCGQKLSGGTNNFALEFGGMIFERIYARGLIFLFMGSLVGCVISKALFYKFFSVRNHTEETKTLTMLLKRGKHA